MGFNTFTASAVWRMRLGMGLIAALVMGLLIAGAIGMRQVDTAKDALLEQSIPTLRMVELQNRQLNALLVELGTMPSLATKMQLDALQTRLTRKLDELTQTPQIGRDINNLLEALRGSSGAAIRTSIEAIDFQIRSDARITEFKSAVDEIIALIRPLSIRVGTRVQMDIIELSKSKSTQQAAEALASDVFLMGQFNDFNYALFSTEEVADSLSNATEPTRLKALENRLSYGFRNLTQYVSAMPATERRREIAQHLRAARDLLFGEDGALALRSAYIDALNRLGVERINQAGIVSEVLKQTNDLVVNAESRIQSSSAQVTATISETTSRLQVLAVLAIALICLIAFVTVERQIVRRLARLRASVTAIAGGDNEHEVNVRGKDELGEMAAALEVFKENSRELYRSNAELARFAYAASHDLRAPLFAIRSLTEWTIEDSRSEMPKAAQDNLNLVLLQIDRLSSLLSNLLDYSQLGREDSSIGAINVDALTCELGQMLAPGDKFRFAVDSNLKSITTYDAPLRQVLLNLFSNAIKHHDRETGEVRLKLWRSGDRLHFEVADDGPGIDTRFHERIFGLFETLRTRDDVEGSGMGLATIRKLVEHYGGKVTVVSDPAARRGTSFRFDWPDGAYKRTALAA